MMFVRGKVGSETVFWPSLKREICERANEYQRALNTGGTLAAEKISQAARSATAATGGGEQSFTNQLVTAAATVAFGCSDWPL